MRRPLFACALLALVGCTSTSHVATTLPPNARAEVRLIDASQVRVSNRGPGRLKVAFGPEVQVWIGPGGRIRNDPDGDATILLETEGKRARLHVEAERAEAIELIVSGE